MSNHPSIEKQLDELARRLAEAKKLDPGPARKTKVEAIEAEFQAVQRLVGEMDADQSAGVADNEGFPPATTPPQ
jgi:hypothetical protein